MKRCRIGLLSDVQYADRPDGHNFDQTVRRCYRGTLRHVERAIAAWAAASPQAEVDLILNLGDTLDGHCHRAGYTKAALERLEHLFSGLSVPVFHVVGNHELYNIPRAALFDSFLFSGARRLVPAAAAAEGLCYHSLSPLAGFRLLILDAYDVSCLGRDPDDERYRAAHRLLLRHNANADPNDPTGLERPEFVRFNGGVGQAQLRWLESELGGAEEKNERVIVVSHIPLDLCCSPAGPLLLWNWEEVSALVRRHSNVVKLVLCGHTHLAMRGTDAAGIAHVALPGLIETPADAVGVGVLHLSPGEVRLAGGGGLVPDLTLSLA